MALKLRRTPQIALGFMDPQLDIDVLPIFRRGGYDQPTLPGLHLAVPPRRTARGRASDLLIIFLNLTGNAPISANQQSQLLAEYAKSYYRTRGSVTAAIRSGAERLNQHLLESNLRTAGSGLQTTGSLTVVAVRETHLYLAQSGPNHAFVIDGLESQHLYDAHLSGRGLGVSRTPTIRFTHAEMREGGLVITSPAPPPTWTATTLKDSHNLRLENLHRRLISQAGPDLTAILFMVKPGQGALHLVQPVPAQRGPTRSPSSPAPAPTTDRDAVGQGTSRVIPATQTAIRPDPPRPRPRGPIGPVADRIEPEAAPRPAPVVPESPAPPEPEMDDWLVADTISEPEVSIAPDDTQVEAPIRSPSESRANPIARTVGPAILAIGRAVGHAVEDASASLRTLLGRMLPSESLLSLPTSVMALIAISVPLIVVTSAIVVYFQRGQLLQHESYLNEARQAAELAATLDNPDELREAWRFTLARLDQAENYQTSEESQALRSRAQVALDALDGVTRLDFQQAILGGLSNTVQVTRMVATTDDLYLLNAEDGSVLRALLTGRGYERDPNFRCSPGAYGAYIVGPIVDIAPLPKGNELNATLLAMDKNGNLLYCKPGEAPLSAPLVPPDSHWGDPVAFTQDAGDLFVLDPQTNAVWIYRGANGSYRDRPRFYFSEEVPTLQNVIDLTVNRNDLYLLHQDGHLTTCTFSALAEAPTRCTDPAVFTDTRPGRVEGPTIAETNFSQILFTQPPDPSIYFLDPDNRAVYHLSLRLNLQRQFRSQTDLPDGPATAFTVSPNRTVFLALGNEVRYAALP